MPEYFFKTVLASILRKFFRKINYNAFIICPTYKVFYFLQCDDLYDQQPSTWNISIITESLNWKKTFHVT